MDPGSRIIIVGHNVDDMKLLYQELYLLGYEVATAYGGAEALQMLQGKDFKAVFAEVDMPQMNGVEFLVEVRTSLGDWDIPFFLITQSEEEDATARRQGCEFAVTAFIMKPFIPADIIMAIQRVTPS